MDNLSELITQDLEMLKEETNTMSFNSIHQPGPRSKRENWELEKLLGTLISEAVQLLNKHGVLILKVQTRFKRFKGFKGFKGFKDV